MPRSTLARHTGAAVFHHVATLIASRSASACHQLVVVLEAVHRRAQLKPVGRIAERVERDLVAAVEQPVEVLEHVAVPSADPGVLSHVDDTQLAVGNVHLARIEEVAPARPKHALGGALALTHAPCRA